MTLAAACITVRVRTFIAGAGSNRRPTVPYGDHGIIAGMGQAGSSHGQRRSG